MRMLDETPALLFKPNNVADDERCMTITFCCCLRNEFLGRFGYAIICHLGRTGLPALSRSFATKPSLFISVIVYTPSIRPCI